MHRVESLGDKNQQKKNIRYDSTRETEPTTGTRLGATAIIDPRHPQLIVTAPLDQITKLDESMDDASLSFNEKDVERCSCSFCERVVR